MQYQPVLVSAFIPDSGSDVLTTESVGNFQLIYRGSLIGSGWEDHFCTQVSAMPCSVYSMPQVSSALSIAGTRTWRTIGNVGSAAMSDFAPGLRRPRKISFAAKANDLPLPNPPMYAQDAVLFISQEFTLCW